MGEIIFFDFKSYKRPNLFYTPEARTLTGGQDEFRENSICSIDLQRKSEGYRGMLKFSPYETLSHGVQGESLPFDSGGCKRNKRFSHLSGFWTHPLA